MGTRLLAFALAPYRHDWTVSVGDWSIGIYELNAEDVETMRSEGHSVERTSVHLGRTYIDTSLSACQVLGLGVVLLVAFVSFVITKGRRSGNTA